MLLELCVEFLISALISGGVCFFIAMSGGESNLVMCHIPVQQEYQTRLFKQRLARVRSVLLVLHHSFRIREEEEKAKDMVVVRRSVKIYINDTLSVRIIMISLPNLLSQQVSGPTDKRESISLSHVTSWLRYYITSALASSA